MIQYLGSIKKAVILIISFCAITLCAATVTAAEAPSSADKLDIVETSEFQKSFSGYQQTMQKAIDLVFIFLGSVSRDTTLVTGFPKIGVLNTTTVNIRQGPGLNEKIIARLTTKGAVVKVLGREGDWIKVSLQDCQGWINRKYLYVELFDDIEQEKVTPKRSEEIKRQAIKFIRHIRWGPDNRNYFWITDLDATMILEPLYPHTEGSNYIMARDLNNKEIFVEFIRNVHEKGQGFVDHHGLGYDNNKSNPRISLVKLFEVWGWVVGTGVELETVETYKEPEELKLHFLLPPIDEEFPIEDEGPASPV
jgi:hypothetical protein